MWEVVRTDMRAQFASARGFLEGMAAQCDAKLAELPNGVAGRGLLTSAAASLRKLANPPAKSCRCPGGYPPHRAKCLAKRSFGPWRVVAHLGPDKHSNAKWLTECKKCSRQRETLGMHLIHQAPRVCLTCKLRATEAMLAWRLERFGGADA